MRPGRRLREVLIGGMVAALLVTAAAQNAGQTANLAGSRLEQLQRELQQQRDLSEAQRRELERIRAAIEGLTAQQRATLAQLDRLAGDVAKLETDVANLNARLLLSERQLADTTAQLQVTQARVERLQLDVREILRAQYRGRSGEYLGLLSQSRSLSDLLIRVRYAGLASAHHTRVIETLRGEVEALGRAREQHARQTRELADLKAQRLSTLEGLRARRAEQSILLGQLRRSEQGQRTLATQRQADQAVTGRTISALISSVQAEQQRLEQERLRRIEEERRRREAERRRIEEERRRLALEQQRAREAAALAARQAAQREQERRNRASILAAQQQRDAALAREAQALREREAQVQADEARARTEQAPLPAAGPLGFPLPGGRVSAPYGNEGEPWMVLSGDPEARAVSAMPGNVLTVTYYAALGWVVLVGNGDLTAVYLGLRDPQVSAGNRVAAGTPLGTVGGSFNLGPGNMGFLLRRGEATVNPGF